MANLAQEMAARSEARAKRSGPSFMARNRGRIRRAVWSICGLAVVGWTGTCLELFGSQETAIQEAVIAALWSGGVVTAYVLARALTEVIRPVE